MTPDFFTNLWLAALLLLMGCGGLATTIAYIGLGTTLKRGSTLIAEVIDFDFGKVKRAMLDASNCDSANSTTEQIPELSNHEACSFNIHFNGRSGGTMMTTLMGDFNNRTSQTWTITGPQGETMVCTGWITAFRVKGSARGKMMAEIEISPQDRWVLTLAS